MKQNSNRSIPWLRTRKQRSGTTHFYLEILRNDRRIEIPLGADIDDALTKRADLLFAHFSCSSGHSASEQEKLYLYQMIKVPMLPISQGSENIRVIKRLTAFIRRSGNSFVDVSEFELEYRNWRDSRLTLRTRIEVALFLKILRWHHQMSQKIVIVPRERIAL
jgi:hypothetical protein